jgi:hypothetical protein
MYTGSLKLVLLQVIPSYQPSELLGSNGLNHRVCNAVWIGALLHVAARSINLAQASAVELFLWESRFNHPNDDALRNCRPGGLGVHPLRCCPAGLAWYGSS